MNKNKYRTPLPYRPMDMVFFIFLPRISPSPSPCSSIYPPSFVPQSLRRLLAWYILKCKYPVMSRFFGSKRSAFAKGSFFYGMWIAKNVHLQPDADFRREDKALCHLLSVSRRATACLEFLQSCVPGVARFSELTVKSCALDRSQRKSRLKIDERYLLAKL
ncbi:hypothetical protein BC938DRAFT_473739 [Jimgerdemannia flammicorona]|uniref:Uncharacterized protein n=1 Tax=Jimgerdemannia flammicorona TaxID=994334 RepID=A0A433Q3F2_9FUNG|nr:hypothetical protein BC938DRAFT_473739 [Jimgerdemannia flammicorona]